MARPTVLSANSIIGDDVVNGRDEGLGKIEEIVIDLAKGRVAYAVLSFGGFLGMGEKLFAVPWDALALDAENERFVLDKPKELLEKAPGFDKNDWPDLADRTFAGRVYEHYDTPAYW